MISDQTSQAENLTDIREMWKSVFVGSEKNEKLQFRDEQIQKYIFSQKRIFKKLQVPQQILRTTHFIGYNRKRP